MTTNPHKQAAAESGTGFPGAATARCPASRGKARAPPPKTTMKRFSPAMRCAKNRIYNNKRK
eukprot:9340953-Pyramimonas_sp.AAC.1